MGTSRFPEAMARLEFYVQSVLDYTSRYNYSTSLYYAPTNLIGEYEKYPTYGDFPEAYCLRTYGKWWKNSESYQPNYRPQDYDLLGAEDYVTVQFEHALIPKDICVYEIYNPGAVVRIWAKLLYQTERPWALLWEGQPEKFPHNSRKFHPKIKQINYLTDTIRLEFNQTHLEYHYAVEAILLGGYVPTTGLQTSVMSMGLLNLLTEPVTSKNQCIDNVSITIEDLGTDFFSSLPNEVILHIFQYLDLKSLSRCARVNKRWNQISADALLYQNINLKPYWYLVNCDTLRYFLERCKTLKKLDLSWCGSDDVDGFGNLVVSLLEANFSTLTHLSLGNCKFVDTEVVVRLIFCSELVDLRLRNLSWRDMALWFSSSWHKINKLTALDLTSSDIDDNQLILLLKANPHLKILIIDLCEKLQKLDQVVQVLVDCNKQISTWSSWKTLSLTAEGVRRFANCPNIKELDLGWCLINKDPGNCLHFIAEGCPQLKRLILSEWRGLNDALIMPVIMSCKELTQLDLLGNKNITSDTFKKALLLLPKLRLLDISYCDSVQQEEVNAWRQQYPHITIQNYII
ncbi:unnamed protein product [Phyllotreta striolata]|uniref:F-box domain-containing protein n=1 Tax=Phyllotreta striolata TaxID=444603 RepID=A0A9N9T9D1_PHYSR|nr:unnamed protein product [Phyllotreta striolata]